MRHMRWVIVIGCLAILGIALGGPVMVQSSVPAGFDSVVIFATNSIQIKKQTEADGDVVVNDLPSGPTLGATQLVLEKDVTVSGDVKADSITIKKDATVEGVVFYNTLSNQGTIGGSETPLDLPVFESLPIFQTGSPGTTDVVVPANGSDNLPAGSYRDIVVGKGATLNFDGGFYEVRSISVEKNSKLTFDLLTEVAVADKLKIEKDSFVGPETGAIVGAQDIVFYIDGINGTGGGLQEKPLAAEVGKNSQIQANIWARNGTLRIEKDTTATGAFLARDVQAEKDVTFELATFFRNRPPVADDDSASTLEDQAVEIDVLANDSDVDGNLVPSSVTVISGPGSGNTSVDSATGKITYTPDLDFNGGDSFTYEVCDDGTPLPAECSTAAVLVTVNPVNDAPTLDDPDDVTTYQDAPQQTVSLVGITAGGGLYAETQALSVTATSDNPSLIPDPTVSYNSPDTTGLLFFTPKPDQNGSAVIIVTVTDDGGTANGGVDTFSQSFTVTVNPVNTPPVADDDSASTDEDTPVTIDVLANDGDVDGYLVPSSVTVIERANGPTSVNSTTGEITYTPNPNFNGGDSLVYEVCDDAGACDTATVTITVSPVNDAPVANGKNVDTTGGLDGEETLTIRLTGSDVDGDTLTFSIVSGPTNGTLGPLTQVPPTSADVEYTPDPPGNLEDSFTFQVDDGNGGTDTAVVQINSGGPPPPVIADDVTVETIKDTPVTVTMQGSAPDGVELTFSIVISPANGTLGPLTQVPPTSADVDYTPNLGYTGQDSFEFQACGDVNDDGDTSDPGECDTATATINVEEPAGEAGVTANDQEVSTPQDTPVAVTLTAGPSGGGEGPAAAAQSQGNTLFDDEVTFLEQLESPTTLFDDEATFLEQLESPTTFDFETESGFPEADPFSADVIGLFAGIYFDAKTFSNIQATSGVQTMTGNGIGDPTPTFTQAVIDFTGLENKPSAFGFFALDLTDGEVIEVTVDFAYGPDQVFDAQLMPGDPEFTPTFLGVIAEGDMIESLTLRGTEAANRSAVRAWLIDDLTVGTPLTFSIVSLPFFGTLTDSNENPITCTTVVDPERGGTKQCIAPVAIPGDTVIYTPAQGFAGLDGFAFQSDDGIVVSTANVSIVVGVVEGSCETDPSLCDNGRP